jgi:hypothetical protein
MGDNDLVPKLSRNYFRALFTRVWLQDLAKMGYIFLLIDGLRLNGPFFAGLI